MELGGISNVAVEPLSQDGAEADQLRGTGPPSARDGSTICGDGGTASSSLPQPRRRTSDRRQCGGQRPATVRRPATVQRPTDGGLLARAEG
ncbi:hypothetical protein ACP70R_045382 [Stipagrostis hirtigluma subsp. patula]